MGGGGGDRWLPDCECAVEEAAGTVGRRAREVAGTSASDGGGGDSRDYGAGVSDCAGRGGEGVGAAWTGRISDCGEGRILEGSRVGRIEGGDEVWRACAAVSARGEGSD